VLATGIEDIRKAASASPSSIYHHFAGIADIVRALVERIAASQYTSLANAVNQASTLEDVVRNAVKGLLAWTFANPDEARFMYQAFAMELAGPERRKLEEAKHGQREVFYDAVWQWIEETVLGTWRPLELSVLLLGATHQACRFYLTGQPIDPAWMRATLPEMAWQAVKSVIAQSRRRPRRAAAPRSR
jgi:AcrR family transcriptional regulator